MSVLNHNFGANRIGGAGIGSKAGQSIYDESSTAKFALGEKLELADGRTFRYGVTAGAIPAGYLVATDVSATCQVKLANKVQAAAGDYSPAVGSLKVQIEIASITADQFAGGYLQILTAPTTGVGEGIQYRIKSNSATSATVTNDVDFELYDPIKVALTTASDIIISGNQYNKLVSATATDMLVAGVSPIAFTSGYYGWFQTSGVATVLVETNGTAVPAIGDNLTLGDGTAGACQLQDAYTEPLIGICAQIAATGEYISVYLRLGAV
jgi:hypothetical protein